VAASGVWDTAEDCLTASAATFRAALASALSFSRQQCLYLRPEPQWHCSLRPGRAIVVAVIEGVYCNRMYSTEGHIAVDDLSDRRATMNAGNHNHSRVVTDSWMTQMH
jgi:hypothetical protein